MKPRKFIIVGSPREILADGLMQIYVSIIPFIAGMYFSQTTNPLFLIFLIIPLLTGLNIKGVIKKYL